MRNTEERLEKHLNGNIFKECLKGVIEMIEISFTYLNDLPTQVFLNTFSSVFSFDLFTSLLILMGEKP
ncbi:hypothetical protein N824_05135 [Pedobacter sp. V48]|nr:hypothetical protein N824_05135 [Pedobacter sp. V48]